MRRVDEVVARLALEPAEMRALLAVVQLAQVVVVVLRRLARAVVGAVQAGQVAVDVILEPRAVDAAVEAELARPDAQRALQRIGALDLQPRIARFERVGPSCPPRANNSVSAGARPVLEKVTPSFTAGLTVYSAPIAPLSGV